MVVLSKRTGPSFSKCFITLLEDKGSVSVSATIVSAAIQKGSLMIKAAAEEKDLMSGRTMFACVVGLISCADVIKFGGMIS